MPWNDRGKYGIRLPEMMPMKKFNKKVSEEYGPTPKVKRVKGQLYTGPKIKRVKK